MAAKAVATAPAAKRRCGITTAAGVVTTALATNRRCGITTGAKPDQQRRPSGRLAMEHNAFEPPQLEEEGRALAPLPRRITVGLLPSLIAHVSSTAGGVRVRSSQSCRGRG
jgi:hypothetical protein